MKSGCLIFVTFNELQIVSAISVGIELITFYALNDYNLVILFDSGYNIWFLRSIDNFMRFEPVLKITAIALLGENFVYKKVSSHYFDQLIVHDVMANK